MSYVDDVEDRTHTVAGRLGEGGKSFLKIRYEVHLKYSETNTLTFLMTRVRTESTPHHMSQENYVLHLAVLLSVSCRD